MHEYKAVPPANNDGGKNDECIQCYSPTEMLLSPESAINIKFISTIYVNKYEPHGGLCWKMDKTICLTLDLRAT